ncbi:coiled-coil domain-containing protein 149-like [Asterias rubens]|uniref:coiled-coil domain-containing protein 149-like n=1 Tax=Asterias rubens TaxID=7604 RepID=UPI0014557852|nr:coiled-coil domain-containing protein 149-like [Asterias rubens]
MAAPDRLNFPGSLNVRSQKDWHTLCSEYNLCKRKLQAKKDALLILAEELDNVRQEKDAFRLMAEQLREKYQTLKKQCSDRERALGLSSNESDPVSERRNHSLAQVLREAREQNKKAEAKIADLEQKLLEAQGDIKLLRENIARQRIGDDGIGTRHFPAHEREGLVNQLEAAREQLQALERDLVAKIDEQTELVTERGYFRDKAERLNQELNYVLAGDEKRIVDVDALIMENKYVKERLKQALEEKSIAHATVSKYKTALERRRGKNTIKLGSTTSGGLLVSPKQVEQLLAEGKSGGIAATPSSVADLQSLASALLDTIHDKNMALNHHRNTNKILGQRVAELEKKLKTLEISGLWNLPPGRNAAFVANEAQNMKAGQSSLVPRQASDASDDTNLVGIESVTSLTSSLNSSTTSSPSHQLGSSHSDNSSLLTPRQDELTEDEEELNELSQLMHATRGVESEALSIQLSNNKAITSTDSTVKESGDSVAQPTRIPTYPSPDNSSNDTVDESLALLNNISESEDIPPVSHINLDVSNYLGEDEEPVCEFKTLPEYLDTPEGDTTDTYSGLRSPSYSAISTRPETEMQDELNSVEDLLETVSEKLSSRYRDSSVGSTAGQEGAQEGSPRPCSPLLCREQQAPSKDKTTSLINVDTTAHCV